MRIAVTRPAVAAMVGAVALAALSSSAEAAHRRHRHRATEPLVTTGPVAATPPLQDRAAYQSGYAFGLFDLGISGTPTALSPYTNYGAGYVQPGYGGSGYPGY